LKRSIKVLFPVIALISVIIFYKDTSLNNLQKVNTTNKIQNQDITKETKKEKSDESKFSTEQSNKLVQKEEIEQNKLSLKHIKRCLNRTINKVGTETYHLDDVFNNISEDLGKSQGNKTRKQLTIFIKVADGSKRMIDVTTQFNAENKKFSELQYFKFDKEGYPELIKIPDAHRKKPTEDRVKEYIQKGELISNQSDYFEDYQNGSLDFSIKDGAVVALDVKGELGHLACDQREKLLNCYCRQ
jgi:hypothetical protein